jgi:formiminotetrahydrofolate cyclodeaminase
LLPDANLDRIAAPGDCPTVGGGTAAAVVAAAAAAAASTFSVVVEFTMETVREGKHKRHVIGSHKLASSQ